MMHNNIGSVGSEGGGTRKSASPLSQSNGHSACRLAAFTSAAVLSYLAFIRFFPILPWSDITLDPSVSH